MADIGYSLAKANGIDARQHFYLRKATLSRQVYTVTFMLRIKG